MNYREQKKKRDLHDKFERFKGRGTSNSSRKRAGSDGRNFDLKWLQTKTPGAYEKKDKSYLGASGLMLFLGLLCLSLGIYCFSYSSSEKKHYDPDSRYTTTTTNSRTGKVVRKSSTSGKKLEEQKRSENFALGVILLPLGFVFLAGGVIVYVSYTRGPEK